MVQIPPTSERPSYEGTNIIQAAKKMSPVEECVRCLENNITILDKSIQELRGRLVPVVVPQAVEKSPHDDASKDMGDIDNVSSIEGMLIKLLSKVREMNQNVTSATGSLRI